MSQHNTWLYRLIRLSIVSTIVIVLGACAGEEQTQSQTSAQPSGSDSQGETASDRLVVYTYDAFPKGLEDLLVAHFDEMYDVTVSVERFQDTGGLYNEVFLTQGEDGADLVIGLDNTYIGKALSEELFQPYRPDSIDTIDPDLIVDDSYRLIPFDYGNVVLNYDSEAISDPPSTWEELTDPRFEESIVLMNPATSSPGRNFLLLTIEQFGEDGYLDYWNRLAPNILTITAGWSEGYGLYTQGEAPIVLSYETSPAYHIAFEDTHRYKNLILDGVGYAQIEVMGIVAGAENATNAQRAIDFVLSSEFQREIAMNQFMYPVREEIELPEAFTAVERPDRTVFIPIDNVDRRFDAWLADWEAVMR
jgi:thiamine transport system substrate-binding protein